MIGFLPPLAFLELADQIGGDAAHVLMQGLLPGEPVDQLQHYRCRTVAIEYLLCRLGDHSINDLGGDGHGRTFVVRYDPEELEIENVEGV